MIILPAEIWQRLLAAFSKTSSLEQVAFLDGIRYGADGVVTTLTIPNAQLAPNWYRVPATAMSEAGKHFSAYEMVRLAQAHTHPGAWTEHSDHDDELAYSQSPGALSIVLPSGARARPSLEACTLLVRTASGWRVQPTANLVRVVPSLLDFRRKERHWWRR